MFDGIRDNLWSVIRLKEGLRESRNISLRPTGALARVQGSRFPYTANKYKSHLC